MKDDPPEYADKEIAIAVRLEAERLAAEIDIFIRMGFNLCELAIVGRKGEQDQVVPRTTLESP